jgi:hypothetical protein
MLPCDPVDNGEGRGYDRIYPEREVKLQWILKK